MGQGHPAPALLGPALSPYPQPKRFPVWPPFSLAYNPASLPRLNPCWCPEQPQGRKSQVRTEEKQGLRSPVIFGKAHRDLPGKDTTASPFVQIPGNPAVGLVDVHSSNETSSHWSSANRVKQGDMQKEDTGRLDGFPGCFTLQVLN